MNIALIGYGKMGHTIETVALRRGHRIGLVIDWDNRHELTGEKLTGCDVAIEFTGPQSAAENLLGCFRAGIPVICGSTGWLERWDEVKKQCEDSHGALLYASNFSIGVNIFFEINRQLAAIMSNHPEYNIYMEEIHHTHKKDAPSGTAITLAEDILRVNKNKTGWVSGETEEPGKLPITSKRIDPAPGTHTITYESEIDRIDITHTAHSREGFAYGAVLAAEFLAGKKGIYSMKDVLKL
jgi:4-hydroxy-tetrahydrodipicolinate reductase